MDSVTQAQKASSKRNATGSNNISSFVLSNSSHTQPSSNTAAAATSKNQSNFQVRKSYVQHQQTSSRNNFSQAANTQQSRTSNRANMAASSHQLTDQQVFLVPQGQKTGKTRNSQARQPQQIGLSTLNHKINATLESEGLPGVLSQQQQSTKVSYQKMSSKHQKIRSESTNPAGGGVVGLPKPTNQMQGFGSELRESQTYTERQTLNAISHQDFKARNGQQYATINSNNIANKPQFNAKNGIEPITQPKAPPQMQNLDMGLQLVGSKQRGYNSNRNQDARSLGPSHKLGNNLHSQINSSLPPTSLHGGQSYLTKTQTISTGHRQQALSLSKHQPGKSGSNQFERRSVDNKGLSKDYYSAIEKGPQNNMVTLQIKQGGSGHNVTSTLPEAKSTRNASQQPASYFNQKKTVSSRSGQRRNQFGGGINPTSSNNQGVISEELPYPPNASSAQQKNGAGANNQSMSLTRNTSQMRTAHLLSSDENKKHTNSQTIQVEKSSSSAALTKNNDLPSTDKIQARIKDGRSPESRKALRKAQVSSAQRKRQLEGMARNKVQLQYGQQQRDQSMDLNAGIPSKNKSNLSGRPSADPLAGGPPGISQTLSLESNSQANKNYAQAATKQNRNHNLVKTSNQTGSNKRLISERKSQEHTPNEVNSGMQVAEAGNFSSVASRIALIQKKQGQSDFNKEKGSNPAMISSYAKTSSGLRTGSFRQHHAQAFSSDLKQHEDELPKQKTQQNGGQIASPNTQNNNFIVSPRSSKTPYQNTIGKSLNSEDYQNNVSHNAGLKPQGSSKLIKSAQNNPFSESPQKDSGKIKTDHQRALQDESQKSNTRTQSKDQVGIKVRQIQSRISQAKINSANLAPEADKNIQGRRQSGSNLNSNLQSNAQQQVLAQTQSHTVSKKQFDLLSSTGGSDEALPKPKSSMGTVATGEQPAGSQGTEKAQRTPSAAEMIKVDFQQPEPIANPLKDFEPAKFASKTHGLITSYAANTHQGIQRNYNEDRVSIILNMTKPASRKDVANWPKCSYFAIYDGHGGSACSDFLKDQLHLIIINQQSFPRDPAQALTTGCLEAERRFMENADRQTPMHERSGSCGIVVLIVGKECYVANVGDSRAIMSADKGKKLFLLSRDHRPNEDYEVSRIVKNGGGIYQTQSIHNVTVPGQDKPVQQFLLGPHRVIPGRLSVSRTFGDIEAKYPKYGGKEGVIIAQPEISQFSVRNDFHDFIVLGCDGIFDRLSNQQVLDACWDTINSNKSAETKQGSLNPKTVHQMSGAMADAIIKQAAIERSMDNLTIVIVSFDNLQMFLQDRPPPTKLENHLFQIKEVESGATSTVVGPTPGLSDSQITNPQLNSLSSIVSPTKNSGKRPQERQSSTIAEVKTEDMEEIDDKNKDSRSITPGQQRPGVSRTQNQSSATKDQEGPQEQQRKGPSSSIVSSARRNKSGIKPSQPTLKQVQMTRNKNGSDLAADSLQVKTRNSERPLDTNSNQRRKAEILPKLPVSYTQDISNNSSKLIEHPRSSQLKSPNQIDSKDSGTAALFTAKMTSESPKPLKKAQINNYRFSKTAKLPTENLTANLRQSINEIDSIPQVPGQQRSRMKSNLAITNQNSSAQGNSNKTNNK